MSRIGMVMDNSVEYVDRLVEIWNEGDTAVLVDWRIPTKEIVKLLEISNVISCYVEEAALNDFIDIDSQIRYIPIHKQQHKIIDFIPECVYERFQNNASCEEALIPFSSGTTGVSKGIILSHYAIHKNAEAVMNYMKLDSSDKIYILKTFAHSSTIVGELLVGLKYHIPIMIAPTITSMHISLKKIFENNITVFCINPTLMYLMNKSLPMLVKENYNSKIKKIYTSGAISPVSEIKKMKELLPETKIYNVYGLSEAGPRVTAQINEYPIGSVGKTIVGVKVDILSKLGEKKVPHQEGYIHVLTEYRFNGYVNGKEKESYREGWLNTGDVGYLDENQNLFILGRADDMILSGSHNVYPDGVEKVILDYEKIQDCIVYGVKSKSLGEKIICMYCANEELVKKELLDFCKERLSNYEIPKEFIKVESIPKTQNGKKSRNLAKKIYVNYSEE